MSRSATLLIVCFALLVFAPKAAADDSVSGTIVSDTTWSSDAPVIISGDVTVPADITLTVEAGATVRFGGNYSLTVNGALQATGSASETITFTSVEGNQSPGAWKGISFGSTVGFPESHLSYVDIRYAETGIRVEDVSNVFTLEFADLDIRDVSSRGVLVIDSQVELEALTIRDFGEEGVLVTGGDSDVQITDADIQQQRSTRVQSGDGLYVREGATVNMSGTKIRLAENGVVAYRSDSTPSLALENNIIKENRRGVFVDPRDSGRAYPEITAND
ncbi:MAG: DUF1565 domain-containing protein, partial [Bacteroidetes bacterium]|nr:DUF1565 domain-containing protein [Bacteroidota bacterium]